MKLVCWWIIMDFVPNIRNMKISIRSQKLKIFIFSEILDHLNRKHRHEDGNVQNPPMNSVFTFFIFLVVRIFYHQIQYFDQNAWWSTDWIDPWIWENVDIFKFLCYPVAKHPQSTGMVGVSSNETHFPFRTVVHKYFYKNWKKLLL